MGRRCSDSAGVCISFSQAGNVFDVLLWLLKGVFIDRDVFDVLLWLFKGVSTDRDVFNDVLLWLFIKGVSIDSRDEIRTEE